MLSALLLLTTTSFAYKLQPFDCCHIEAAQQQAERPMNILVVPPADVRLQLVENPKELEYYATFVGLVRAAVGIPYGVHSREPARDYIARAWADELRAVGHQVTVSGSSAPGFTLPALSAEELSQVARGAGEYDLVVHGTLNDWTVDVSAYGTYKLVVDVDVLVVSPASGSVVASEKSTYYDHDTSEASGWTPFKDAQKVSKEWYGKKRWYITAIVEMGMIETSALLLQADTPLRAVFMGAQKVKVSG